MLIIGPYREKEAHSAQFDTDMLARWVLVRKGLSSPFFLHFYKVTHDLFSFCILHDCRIIVHVWEANKQAQKQEEGIVTAVIFLLIFPLF